MKISVFSGRSLILYLLFPAMFANAQTDQKYMPDKPGSSKIQSNLGHLGGNERSGYENNLAKVAGWFLTNNAMLAKPKGFDMLVWYFEMFDDNYKKRECNFGTRSQMRFDFQLFIKENGKETKWTVECPSFSLFINNTASGHGSNYCNYEGYRVQVDPPALEIPLDKALAELCDLFAVFKLEKEISPGVRLYGDGNLVVFNPARPPFWVPVTVKEVMELKLAFYGIRPEDKMSVYPYLKKAFDEMTPETLNAPAYEGGDPIVEVTSETDGFPIMRFNKDYWDRSLPKTAIQFMTMKYQPGSAEEMQEHFANNGYPDYTALTREAINFGGLAGLVEKK